MARRPRFRRKIKRLSAPVAQLAAAAVVMLAGGWLVGVWCVGVLLIVAGGAVAADALLRDSTPPQVRSLHTHEDVIERFRRAK